MYLFTREARLGTFDGIAWAQEVCEKVRSVTGQDIQLWSRAYSPGFGTITWSTWYADMASMEAVGDKLQADSGYMDLTAKGRQFIEGGVDDGLLRPIHGEPDPDRPLEYVTGVRAVVAGGNGVRALGAGVEIAQKAESITGLPTMFLSSITGPYGSVGWLTGYESIGQLETANDALAGNTTWLALIDTTEGAFLPDAEVTQQTIYRKLV